MALLKTGMGDRTDLQPIISYNELQKAHNKLEGWDCHSERFGTGFRNGLRSVVMLYNDKGKYLNQGQNNPHNILQATELSGIRVARNEFCIKALGVWADIKLNVR